ncbi:MAG: rhomboid family intramembrane serine protease [Gemmatimonadaceae bacterium]|nr:rhomboid family intramembrane serine protease [Gemmatimonadaceae bacterium]
MTTVVRAAARTLKQQATVLGGSVTAVWAGFGAQLASGGAITRFGIRPRSVEGLWGIFFAPFLHGSPQHLIANTVPLLILGWLVMLRDAKHFVPVTIFSMLGAGIFAWTLGAPGSVHIGASGVVFGYLGFLMLAGWYQRSLGAIAISVLVTVLWGGVVLGVMPGQPGISWQAHFGGFVGGIMAARALAKRSRALI